MKVEVRRYATLAPPDSGLQPGEPQAVTLEDTATVERLLEKLALPSAAVHLVIINGRIVHDRTAPLGDRDRVALFPPIGGG